MIIRPAAIDDAPAIARVQVDSYRRAYAGILPQAVLDDFSTAKQEQDWRGWMADHPGDILLVAEDAGGGIAGYTLARPGPTGLEPYDGEVLALHVAHFSQGQGVGRGLLEAACAALRGAGCRRNLLWVLANNGAALGFYQHLGWRQVGQRAREMGGEGETVLELACGEPGRN